MQKNIINNTLEIELTLVSSKRTILILLIGVFILFLSIIISGALCGFQSFLFIAIIVFGTFGIYFLLKYFARFVDTVIVNQDYISVGEKYKIYWKDINTYEYSNTGLLVGFIFRTADDTYTLTGLLKGSEGEKFKLIQDKIVQIIDEWNSNQDRSKILPYDYYVTKTGKRSMLISMVFVIVALLIVSIFMIVNDDKLKLSKIIYFGMLCLMTLFTIMRYFSYRKK